MMEHFELICRLDEAPLRGVKANGQRYVKLTCDSVASTDEQSKAVIWLEPWHDDLAGMLDVGSYVYVEGHGTRIDREGASWLSVHGTHASLPAMYEKPLTLRSVASEGVCQFERELDSPEGWL